MQFQLVPSRPLWLRSRLSPELQQLELYRYLPDHLSPAAGEPVLGLMPLVKSAIFPIQYEESSSSLQVNGSIDLNDHRTSLPATCPTIVVILLPVLSISHSNS